MIVIVEFEHTCQTMIYSDDSVVWTHLSDYDLFRW